MENKPFKMGQGRENLEYQELHPVKATCIYFATPCTAGHCKEISEAFKIYFHGWPYTCRSWNFKAVYVQVTNVHRKALVAIEC